jgi:phenylacetate-CoA oxygenase PaaH subunit
VKVYEVFLKKAGKDPFVHAGSLEASDDGIAELLARESYVRRGEGEQMWLVERSAIVVADDDLIAPNADKPHRHNDGARVAEHRRAARGRS